MMIRRSIILIILLMILAMGISYSVIAASPIPQPEPINPRLVSLSRDKTRMPVSGSLGVSPTDPSSVSIVIPASKIAFESLRDGNWEIYIVDGDGANLTRLTNDPAIEVQPRLNRGCTRLVYTSKPESKKSNIYTMNIDGTNVTQLTRESNDNISPAWSPDGSKIVFEAYRDEQAEIYVMNADGSNQTRLTYSDDFDGLPTWSPDGTKIAFVSRRTGGYRIWVMNADGSGQRMLSNQPYSENPIWSPDGSKIAYDADGDNNGFQELWLMNADGSDQHVIINLGSPQDAFAAGWSPDGRYIAFTHILWEYYEGEWYWWYARLFVWDSLLPYSSPSRLTSEDTDWKADLQTIDTNHSFSSMRPLPRYSRASGFPVTWGGFDVGEAGMGGYDVQYKKQLSDNWLPWQTNTPATQVIFSGNPGETIYFRTRSHDNHWNYEPWNADYQTSTTLFTWQFSGNIRDIRENPIQSASLEITPAAITPIMTNPSGLFLGHLMQEGVHSVELMRNGYTPYIENISFYKDKNLNLVLPPAQDFISNGDFEYSSLSDWQVSGTITPSITSLEKQQGTFSAMLGRPYFFSEPLNIATLQTFPSETALTFDHSGAAHIMWEEYDGNNNITWIMYTVCDRERHCTPVEALFMGEHPTLETDKAGQIHTAWLSGNQIYHSKLLPSGTWSTPEVVGSASDYSSGFPDLAFDSYNQAHIVWSSDRKVYYAYKQNNQNWSQPEQLSEEDLQGFYFPVIAISKEDYIHVAWGTFGYYVGYRGRSLSGAWEPIHIIDELYGYRTKPGLAICPDSTLYISWAEHISQPMTYLISRNSDGSWSSPVTLGQFEGKYTQTKLLCKPDGTLIVLDGQDLSYRSPGANWSPLISVFGVHRNDISDQPYEIASNPRDDELAWMGFTNFNEYTNPTLSRFTVSAEQTGTSRISQRITLPAGIHRPTLSFFAKYVTKDSAANDHLIVSIDDGVQATDLLQLGANQEMTHYWFDLQDWVSKTITVTFALSTKANNLPSTAYIDEVHLASWATPIVQSVTPEEIKANLPFTLSIIGENFIPGVQARIDDSLDGSVEWIDGQTLEVNFDRGLPPGVHWLWISNPSGETTPFPLKSGSLLFIPIIRR